MQTDLSQNPIAQVRAACEKVADQARFVHIDIERLPAYAVTLPLEQIQQPEHDAASHYLGHGDATVAFFITLDSINFGSGYFPHLRKRPGMSGYFTIASSLNDYYRTNGPLLAQALTTLNTRDCTRIFQQEAGDDDVRELMELFARALNDLGNYLLAKFDGSFVRLVEAAQGSAERLVGLLTEMPFFKDVETYNSMQVPFFKRAQLTGADLAIAFGKRGPGRFFDLDQLTIFADNLVPHVLRMDGVLRYEESLAQRIDMETLIPAGSPEEVEIRACALHTVELLAATLRAAGKPVTAMQLDYLLWNRGQAPYYKGTKPRHRTRTVFY
jgi:hypothetical protein